jgi:hypothetical protein
MKTRSRAQQWDIGLVYAGWRRNAFCVPLDWVRRAVLGSMRRAGRAGHGAKRHARNRTDVGSLRRTDRRGRS